MPPAQTKTYAAGKIRCRIKICGLIQPGCTGIKDTFGMSGKADELMSYYKITADDIVELF